MANLLKKAIDYHKQGWAVIPIPYKKKAARVTWKKYQKTPPTEECIRNWFIKGNANIAVLCGAVSSGLTIIDFDDEEVYKSWKQNNPELARRLPTVKTFRGYHVYCRTTVTKTKKFKGGDIKSSGYVLLPPSIHPSGDTYRWLKRLNGELPLLELDEIGLFTEEPEDTDDTEEIEEKEAIYRRGTTPLTEESEDTKTGPLVSKKFRSKPIEFKTLDDKTQRKIQRAIDETCPTKEGIRNRMIFQYCRWLKSIPKLENSTARQVKSLCRMWHEKAQSAIGTKPFDDTWADFSYAWDRVKYPKGHGIILKKAVEMALGNEKRLEVEDNYDSKEAHLLIRVIYFMSQLNDEHEVWLSCRDAADILGVSPPKANKYIKMLEVDEVILLQKKHTSKRAARYILNKNYF